MRFPELYRSRLFFLLPGTLLLTSCSTDYQWGWYILSPATEHGQTNLGFLAAGFVYTLGISLTAFILT